MEVLEVLKEWMNGKRGVPFANGKTTVSEKLRNTAQSVGVGNVTHITALTNVLPKLLRVALNIENGIS